MLYSPRAPKPPKVCGEWQVNNKRKQIVMPAKPRIRKDEFTDSLPNFKHTPPAPEMVNNPTHYGGKDNTYEVIKVCEAWGLDKDAYLFNVVKYVARAGKKDAAKELEDLKKAIFYLNRKVENLSK